MRILNFAEFMAASGLNPQLLKTLRRRDQLALAFARRDAYLGLKYIELDPTAVLLSDELSASFGRKVAAQLVRVWCDEWAKVVAIAETTKTPCYFWIVEVEDGGVRSNFPIGSTESDVNVIRSFVAKNPMAAKSQFVRAIPVDITRILSRVRANAKRAGFDLSDPFLPAPDDKRFKDLFDPYTRLRDRAVAAVKARKGRKRGEDNDDIEELRRRAGVLARANIEAGVDDRPHRATN